jgi:hypothetical protein
MGRRKKTISNSPAMHLHVLSNFIGNNGFIFLTVCPLCFVVNDPIPATFGKCSNCGYDVNADVYNNKKTTL